MLDRAGLKPARLFIALWPEEAVRQEFSEAGASLHKRLAGRLTRPETIHLTLVFVGELARERIPELLGELGAVKSPVFNVTFDQAGCWRHNRIAYLAPSQPPQALFDLVTRLEQTLDKLAITYDRRPYKPHVTLIRKAQCENPALGRVSGTSAADVIRPVSWSASRFVLVESVPIPEGMFGFRHYFNLAGGATTSRTGVKGGFGQLADGRLVGRGQGEHRAVRAAHEIAREGASVGRVVMLFEQFADQFVPLA